MMNWLDFVFIGILSLSIIVSLFRGLIREVFSLLVWVAAFWVAYQFVDLGADKLSPFIELPSARHLISFVGLFISTLMVGGMINFLINKMVTKTGLAASDRFFGMFFGLFRGLILVVAITFFIRATPLSEDPWWQESQLAPHFGKISEWVREKMPEDISESFSFILQQQEKQMQELKDKLQEQMIQELQQSEPQQPQSETTEESSET